MRKGVAGGVGSDSQRRVHDETGSSEHWAFLHPLQIQAEDGNAEKMLLHSPAFELDGNWI